MCGIIGYNLKQKIGSGNRNFLLGEVLVEGLKKLDYRGYDSCGISVLDGNGLVVAKQMGSVNEVNKRLKLDRLDGNLGIGHTRWATCGKVSNENAHPFVSEFVSEFKRIDLDPVQQQVMFQAKYLATTNEHQAKTDKTKTHKYQYSKIAIVHNGIIRNYDKKYLIKKGFKFLSDTDSEFIAHYFANKINEYYDKLDDKNTKELKLKGVCRKICADFLEEIDGEFAILVIVEGVDEIFVIKRGSPIVVCRSEIGCIVASDVTALTGIRDRHIQDIIFMDDDEFAIVGKDKYAVFNKSDKNVSKHCINLDDVDFGFSRSYDKGNYEHFMLKEIHDQPRSLKRLVNSIDFQSDKIDQVLDLCKRKKIIFTGSGTSYFSTLLGVYLMHKAGIAAQTLIASEFNNFIGVDKDTVVIALSQSGETMDVIDAIKYAKTKGADIISLVNVPYSTIGRLSNISLQIFAGQEIAVASTKSFTNQSALLMYLSGKLSNVNIAKVDRANVKFTNLSFDNVNLAKEILESLALDVSTVILQSDKINKIAKTLVKQNDVYIIGEGISYPIAREIALKLKEVSYIHAEGMMAGELKHGTLALIKKGTPVISVMFDDAHNGAVDEVRARGADVIVIGTNKNSDICVKNTSKTTYKIIPSEEHAKFAILSAVVGQLLAYYLAKHKNLPIDKPRNLAKSVTVR